MIKNVIVPKVAIIGGSGLYSIPLVNEITERFPITPWGPPSDKIRIGQLKPPIQDSSNSKSYYSSDSSSWPWVAFLSRHARNHMWSPSTIPYRANFAALKMLGVETVLSVSAVGSLQATLAPGDFVLPDQLIDLTAASAGSSSSSGRPSSGSNSRCRSYFEELPGLVAHVPMAEPMFKSSHRLTLAQELRKAVAKDKILSQKSVKVHDSCDETGANGICLICIQGPAFSTRAESKLYRSIYGADVIGMTASPEAYLARELELDFQILGLVTDYDSWRGEYSSEIGVLHGSKSSTSNVPDIMAVLQDSFNHETLTNLLGSIIGNLNSLENPWKGQILRQALIKSDNTESSKTEAFKFMEKYVL